LNKLPEGLETVNDLLACTTPESWLQAASANLQLILIDHANCEKKAAAAALNLMFRYVDRPELLDKMSRLAREELRHFEQVHAIIRARGIDYPHLPAARYANGLRQHVRKQEPHRLLDLMVIGAFIEARSCERFAALAPLLDDELKHFYTSLLRSEARHFRDYLKLGVAYAEEPIEPRIAFFAEVEADLIQSPDPELRFHSGVPVEAVAISAG
jgi:tRNA-(ms[2]io[6]A)-hydroxylase